MAKQFGNVWLCRDKKLGNGYGVFNKRPVLEDRDDRTQKFWEDDSSSLYFSTRDFHRLFPKIRLKPGEGPMRAQISIEL